MAAQSSPSRKNAPKTRGRPFKPGNPGRPKGSRNKATLAVEKLLDGEANALTRKAIDLALLGDGPAMRICMERIAAPRKDRPISFPLPPLKTAEDAITAQAAVAAAMAGGEITPSEAGEVSKVIETFCSAILARDLEKRLAKLEKEAK
jgi:hypothetical protein